MSDGGKGSSPRPFSVSQEVFEQNWDRIFKKEKPIQETFSKGDLRVNSMGILEQYSEGYWQEVENRR